MSNFKFHDWDKKPRTMLRFIKPGDIFCFKLNESRYCFGRIISKITTGHVAEIFNYISSEPSISERDIISATRLIEPVILNSYTLFDRKREGEWQIIGHQSNYTPEGVSHVYFAYGVGNSCKKVDVFNNEELISEDEARAIPALSPRSDAYIKDLIFSVLK